MLKQNYWSWFSHFHVLLLFLCPYSAFMKTMLYSNYSAIYLENAQALRFNMEVKFNSKFECLSIQFICIAPIHRKSHLKAQNIRKFVAMLLSNKSYMAKKSVDVPFKCCHICNEHSFVGQAEELSILAAPMKDLPHIQSQCQTDFFSFLGCCCWFLF